MTSVLDPSARVRRWAAPLVVCFGLATQRLLVCAAAVLLGACDSDNHAEHALASTSDPLFVTSTIVFSDDGQTTYVSTLDRDQRMKLRWTTLGWSTQLIKLR